MRARKGLLYPSLALVASLLSYSAFAQSMGAPASGTGDSPQIIWNQPGQTSAPPANAKRPPVAGKPAPMAQNPDQRNIDDRELNKLAVEYMHINPKAADSSARLAKLSKRVEAFHQALFTRGYNAMDILKDTENLQKRITVARSKAAEASPASAPTSWAAPAPQPSAAPQPVPPPQPTTSQ